ncbi:winged helix-turn-helix domain-containing protein [Streptomyces avicenniae]|uniref:winged helix-turn-helix domain-containing protein n=1 Tax=Streptomyces avicenniae TaxID=500153 RepID=UPI00069ABD5D|nr:winged helix-turn-helix domain-containing protein [Streptomyces avicenniae]
MLRVHFSGEDLGRTRLADGPLPMWETILSLHRFQRRDGGLLVRRWRSAASRALPPDWRLLSALVPPAGYFPDFLTPPDPFTDVGEAVTHVAATPRATVRRDLAHLDRRRTPAPFADALWRGAPLAYERLGAALAAYHAAVLAPFWSRVEEQVLADRARRAARMLGEGTEGLLGALPPALRWRPPVLEVDYPVEQDLVLGGRGLVLVPSFFCLDTGVTLLHDDRTPVLVYPVEHRPAAEPPGAQAHRLSLAALLGHTRAALLEALEQSGSTGALARRAGVLPSSASQHLAVLRDAGLVRTVRSGRTALHSRTAMGAALARRGYVNPAAFAPDREPGE